MSKIETLRKELTKAREKLVRQGCRWNPATGNLMDIKPFEFAYQKAIERVFPDFIWWKVTNYWDIFDAMAGGINDKDMIEEIIAHIDSSLLDEALTMDDRGAKVETNHTYDEYRELFGSKYDDGELWDFSEDDFNSAIDINPDIVYWKIDVEGEPRYFETCEICEDTDLCREDCEASKELTEATSNFPTNGKFELYAFYDEDGFMDLVNSQEDCPNEQDFANDKNEIDYREYLDSYARFVDKCKHDIDVAILNIDSIEVLEDKLYEFNKETESLASLRWVDGVEDSQFSDFSLLSDISVCIKPGYYQGHYLAVDGESNLAAMTDAFAKEQENRIATFLEFLAQEFGLTHLKGAYLGNNEGSAFLKVNEAKEEDKNKKARFIGDAEAEKTFFNVANGTCEALVLREAPHKSNEEMFDWLISFMDFGLVKYTKTGEFGLRDLQGANLGNIESDRFDNAAGIIDRLGIYLHDYFLGDEPGELSFGDDAEADNAQDEWNKNVVDISDAWDFFDKHERYKSDPEFKWIYDACDFIINKADKVDLNKCKYKEDDSETIEEGCSKANEAVETINDECCDWLKSVGCWGAPGDEESNDYHLNQGAYCLVDEKGNLVGELTDDAFDYILQNLRKGTSQFVLPDDIDGKWLEIEFSGDCDWGRILPYIIRDIKPNKTKGVVKFSTNEALC